MSVERFECSDSSYMYSTQDHVNPNWGGWVRASDYDALRVRCEALKDAARSVYKLCEGDYPAHSERGLALEDLRIALADADKP